MHGTIFLRRTGACVAGGTALFALGWAGYGAVTWLRFGHAAPVAERDELVDRYLPRYDVIERHQVRVAAPREATYAAARAADINQSPLVRGIFRGRESFLRTSDDATRRPESLLEQTLGIGWGVLEESPGREIVVGAYTRPWESTVVFHRLRPDRFATFDEPGWVKIVWTLRADSAGPSAAIFRTETRALATDSVSRERFRRYWSVFSPGILLIRSEALRLVKADAERRTHGEVRASSTLKEEAP